jgi:hypothetical protein
MPVTEEDPLANFGATLDHFYSIVKTQMGEIEAGSKFQLQATAVPVAVTSKDPWFSLGVLSKFFDITVEPVAISDSAVKINSALRLSKTTQNLLAIAMSLVEVKDLSPEAVEKIKSYKVEMGNIDVEISSLLGKFQQDWSAYAAATLQNPSDVAAFIHWSANYPYKSQVKALRDAQNRVRAMIAAFSAQSFATPSHQEVADAFALSTSGAVRMRYPRYPDSMFPEKERALFGPVYFAGLTDDVSPIFDNLYTATPMMSVAQIEGISQGALDSTITKESIDNHTKDTSWSASGGGSGFFGIAKVSGGSSETTKIKEEFKHVQSIKVQSKGLVQVPISYGDWFPPDLINNNDLIRNNSELFERFLGEKGTLLYYPTHLIIARGMKLTFTSSQQWQFDYERHWKAGGGGSASFFGISWGGEASKNVDETQHRVEKRGHELILDDGENSLRLLGYTVKGMKKLEKPSFFDAKVAFASKAFEAAMAPPVA